MERSSGSVVFNDVVGSNDVFEVVVFSDEMVFFVFIINDEDGFVGFSYFVYRGVIVDELVRFDINF